MLNIYIYIYESRVIKVGLVRFNFENDESQTDMELTM